MRIDNCRRCGRLFTRESNPLCDSCSQISNKQRIVMHEFIQQNPGISIEEISERFDISTKEIEVMLFSGAFGTTHQLIRTLCAKCKCEMTAINRVGHFCYTCNKILEKEVSVGRSIEMIEDPPTHHQEEHSAPSSQTQMSEENGAVSVKPPPPAKVERRGSAFGFKRIS